MTRPLSMRLMLALLLALIALVPASAVAADTYEASFNAGYLNATANADFTEATIDSVSVSFDRCGTAEGELTCTWEGRAVLVSHPESRCDPSTPEEQVVWSSEGQSGNGSVSDGSVSFPLEGCRGQTLVFELEDKKTYEAKSPLVVNSGTSIWGLFTFGYHPFEEADKSIPTEYNPPPYEYPLFSPNVTPKGFDISSDCHSLTISDVRYVFAFGQMGCHKAGNLARARFLSARAPQGYVCQRLPQEGVRCWRRHQPAKFFEWRRRG